MASPRDYDLPVTEAEYAALVAAEQVERNILADSQYQITAHDREIRKRGDEAMKTARDRSDAWHRKWERATTPEAKAAVEREAEKAESRMRIYRVRVPKIRKSNHALGVRAKPTLNRKAQRMKNTKKALMGSTDPYMGERTIKTRKGTHTDLVAEIGQNGGGGDFWAGLFLKHSDGETQVLQMKYGYKTAENAKRTAIRLFDAHVGRGGFSRSGGKAAFANWESWYDKDGESEIANANQLIEKCRRKRAEIYDVEVNKLPHAIALMRHALENKHAQSYRTAQEEISRADRVRSSFSRSGGKAKYGAWREGGFDFKTRTLGEEQVQLLVNEGSGWMNAGVVADEQEARNASRGYVKTRNKGFVYIGGVWQKAKASRSGGKAKFLRFKVQIFHGGTLTGTLPAQEFMEYARKFVPNVSRSSFLEDVIAKFNEAAERANMNTRAELQVTKSSRSGAKARFASWRKVHSEGWGDLSESWTATIGGRVWSIVVDASNPSKSHLMYRDSRGVPVHVKEGSVESLKRWAETAKLSRSGGKAAFAKWEQEQTKKHGQPISEFTAKIGRDFWKIEVREAAGGNISASLYLWDDLRGYIAMGQSSRLQELQNRAESLSRNKEARAVSNIERIANYSRSGGKSKFAINTYDAAEQYIATIEDRIAQKRRQLDDRERWCGKANRLMSAADAGDAKAQTEVIGIARLLEAATRSGFARSGGKAKFAHWTESTRVVESLSYKNIRTGQTVSGGGAVPWRTDAEKKEWKPVRYFVFMDTARGTTFGGQYSTEAQAQSALDKAKREHAAEVAKYGFSRTGEKSTHAAPKFKIGDRVAVTHSSLVGTIVGFESASELGNVQSRGKYDNLENKYHLKGDNGQSLNWHSEGRLVRASRSSAKSTNAKAAFASANPIANKVAQLMSEGATRDQAVAFAADARNRGEL